ncbi:hypothetical protein D3C81_1618100 [compost metagenome]
MTVESEYIHTLILQNAEGFGDFVAVLSPTNLIHSKLSDNRDLRQLTCSSNSYAHFSQIIIGLKQQGIYSLCQKSRNLLFKIGTHLLNRDIYPFSAANRTNCSCNVSISSRGFSSDADRSPIDLFNL